jgi:hypothetical protein
MLLDLSESHPRTARDRLAVTNITGLLSVQDIANKRVFHRFGGTFADPKLQSDAHPALTFSHAH